MTMKIWTKFKDWYDRTTDFILLYPILLMLLITAVFVGGAYTLYKTVGLPRFIQEGYVYKVEYKDWVFYTDYISYEYRSTRIEFKDIRTKESVTIGSDYIITQVPQEDARNTTYRRDGDLPQEDSDAR